MLNRNRREEMLLNHTTRSSFGLHKKHKHNRYFFQQKQNKIVHNYTRIPYTCTCVEEYSIKTIL